MEAIGVSAEIIGVGLVESSIGIARVLMGKPPGVLLIGSCGAYAGCGLSIGDIVLGTRFLLAASRGELGPIPNEARPKSLPRRGRSAVVCSTLSITTDDEEAARLEKQSGAHVENLEAFAVARACELAGVPFTAVLGVTNTVGKNGRAEWRANAERVAELVIEVVKRSC